MPIPTKNPTPCLGNRPFREIPSLDGIFWVQGLHMCVCVICKRTGNPLSTKPPPQPGGEWRHSSILPLRAEPCLKTSPYGAYVGSPVTCTGPGWNLLETALCAPCCLPSFLVPGFPVAAAPVVGYSIPLDHWDRVASIHAWGPSAGGPALPCASRVQSNGELSAIQLNVTAMYVTNERGATGYSVNAATVCLTA